MDLTINDYIFVPEKSKKSLHLILLISIIIYYKLIFYIYFRYFEIQLKLSEDFNLPLFLHCRDAAPTFLDILKRNPNLIKSGGVVHSFDGSLNEAKDIINLGFYIGINGW